MHTMRIQLALTLAVGLLAMTGCTGDTNGGGDAQGGGTETGRTTETPPETVNPLLDPKAAAVNQDAPGTYKVKLETSKGDIVIQVHRDWARRGADRFYNLVKAGYYDDVRFFRVVDDFMVQFGISGDPAVNSVWKDATILDDPVRESNRRGTITFATSGRNSRTSQVFINFKDNTPLDGQGFAPFGEVIEGMDTVVDELYAGYGEGAPRGAGPSQPEIQARGNEYLTAEFPQLDYVKKATIIEESSATGSSESADDAEGGEGTEG
jgi:peptidyl-prolyl cis-trans isomerase A (cyclophilin A)